MLTAWPHTPPQTSGWGVSNIQNQLLMTATIELVERTLATHRLLPDMLVSGLASDLQVKHLATLWAKMEFYKWKVPLYSLCLMVLLRDQCVFSKMGWKSGKDRKVHCTALTKFSRVLLAYRSMPQTINRVIPAELMFNCHSLIWLDLVWPDARKPNNHQGHPTSIFGEYLFGRRFEI